MGRLMFKDKCYTAMRSLQVNENEYATIITSGLQDYYLLDSNLMDTIGAATKTAYALAPNIERTQGGVGNIYSANIRLSSNVYYLCLPYYGNKLYGFLSPIDKRCQTIEIDAYVSANSSAGSYNTSRIILSYDQCPNSYSSYPTMVLNSYLTFYAETAAEINAQPHITINSTDPRNLSRQTVIINIAELELTDDIYLGIYSCDCDAFFRSIKICF